MNEKEIASILERRLCSVYCDTCDSDKTEANCEYCTRKTMMWGISKEYAKSIAEEILREGIK